MDKNSAIMGVFLMAITGMLLFPLVRALARRIERRAGDVALSDEVAHLRDRVAELEASTAHVAELEDRLDFAERMLVQRNDAAQFPVHHTPI
jgi:hypothetical protein